MPSPAPKREERPAQSAQAPGAAPAHAGPEGAGSQQAWKGYVQGLQQGKPQAGAGAGVEEAQQQLKQKTENAGVTVGGQLPANRLLVEGAGGDRVSTAEATRFSVGVARSGIWAEFSPGLTIRPGDWQTRWATGGIELSRLNYSFASGKCSITADTGVAGDVLDWFVDVQGRVESKLGETFASTLPARLRQPGYDPYTDEELPALLQQIVASLGSMPSAGESKGGDLLNDVQKPTLSAWFQLKKSRLPLDESFEMVVDERASVSVTAHLLGTAKQALKDPFIEKLDLSASDIRVEHKTAGMIAGIKVHGAEFGPGLALNDLRYDLGLEGLANAGKLLLLFAQLSTGQDLGVRDQNAVRLEGLRKEIDAKAKEKLPELLRQQVRENDGAIPGYSLARMMRVKPEKAGS
jgi:hypothetical protein